MQHLPIHPSKRHPLTGEPIKAVGHGKRGPIWPILGASDDPPPADPPPGNDPPSDDPPADDFEAKFNAQRTINRQLEKDAKPFFAALKAHGLSTADAVALIEKAKSTPPKGDDDPIDADAIRRDAEKSATEAANAKIIRSEVRALAAEAFANPADALHNLDLSDYEVDDNGELTDPKKVKADLAQVIKDNPHYAKKGTGPRPDPSQGPRGDSKTDPGPGMPRLRQAYANTPSK